MKLSELTSKPVPAGTVPLSRKEAEVLLKQINAWSLGVHTLGREFLFKNFHEAVDFVDRVAALANEQDHHPDIFVSYNKVQLTLSTHTIGGLSMNDFIMAAKIDVLADQKRGKKAA